MRLRDHFLGKTKARGCAALAALALAMSGGFAMAFAAESHIITWGGNSAEWNRQLHVDAIRLGCSSAPATCVSDAERSAQAQGVKTAFLAVILNATRAESDATAYSRLSLSHPVLHEVGFDDFVSQCERQKLPLDALSAVLAEYANGLKSANPNLGLGITLYMDQISSTEFPLADLSSKLRDQVDYVHLYPHYRRESQSFAAAAEKVRMIFGKARVIAGVYAYDRRDYLPCARGSSAPCSNEEEINLYRSSWEERWSLLRSGEISSIEFYPGNFGLEQEWSGWQNPRSCSAGRRQECVANTQAMREIVRQTLREQSPLAAPSRQGTIPK